MQTQTEEPRHHYFGSQLELTDEGDIEVLILLSLHHLNTEPGIEPQGEISNTIVDTTPNELATHPTDLTMSTPECEDAFLQEGELCSVGTGTLD